MTTKERNSSIEVLRLFCILGILCMHLCAPFIQSNNILTLVQLNIINSIFNICVTCFILISGYFGITQRLDRLFHLWCIVIFYSIVDAVISLLLSSPINIIFLVKSIFPTITGKYWYFTTYFLLVIFSPYINKIPMLLSQKQFKSLLSLLILFFYICPTFFYFEIIKDNGKGPVNMFIVYLIGRYISIYGKNYTYTIKKGLLYFLSTCFTAFLLNLSTSLLRGYSFAPFARDNSIFMLLGAITFFLLFQNMNFYTKTINVISNNIFAVYISETIFRKIIITYLSLNTLDGKWYLIPTIAIYAIIVFLLCNFLEVLRKNIFSSFEKRLFQLLTKFFLRFHKVFPKNNW